MPSNEKDVHRLLQTELQAIQYRWLAIPSEEGILITGASLRAALPLVQEQQSYAIADLQSHYIRAGMLVDMIETQIPVIWMNPHERDKDSEPTLIYRGLKQDMTLASRDYAPICKIYSLEANRLLLIHAPKSVHYQVKELLYDLRSELKARQEPSSNQESATVPAPNQNPPQGQNGSLF